MRSPPRECGWNDVRDLETAPPSEARRTGRGLIYEVFGPRDGKVRPFATGPTAYDAVPGASRTTASKHLPTSPDAGR
jgi:hypothetical protein